MLDTERDLYKFLMVLAVAGAMSGCDRTAVLQKSSGPASNAAVTSLAAASPSVVGLLPEESWRGTSKAAQDGDALGIPKPQRTWLDVPISGTHPKTELVDKWHYLEEFCETNFTARLCPGHMSGGGPHGSSPKNCDEEHPNTCVANGRCAEGAGRCVLLRWRSRYRAGFDATPLNEYACGCLLK